MPCGWSSWWAVITVTPLANRPKALRNWRGSKDWALSGIRSLSLETPVLHDHADIVGIDQVGGRPAIQVVFGHALFGESFVLGGLAAQIGHHQGFEPDALMVAEIVALVQFMPAAEFGAYSVPH